VEYKDYSNWKGWLTEVPFGELSANQNKLFQLQLKRFHIPYRGINALEIGYGNGSFVKFLIDNNSQAEGVEIQDSLLEAARAIGVPLQASINDVTCGPYDLIVAFDVLEHLTIEELQSLFRRCESLLKKDGAMLFRFPNAESFAGLGAQNGDFTHITAIAQTKLQQIIEPFGFIIEKYEGEIIYPKKRLVSIFRSVFRYILMKGMGVGSGHFFSTNVVAFVKRQHGE
jgi:2-polyprenyl-3-methyl-5-hydroxy-6-metoxy-1,4-benzoquinol methylase